MGDIIRSGLDRCNIYKNKDNVYTCAVYDEYSDNAFRIRVGIDEFSKYYRRPLDKIPWGLIHECLKKKGLYLDVILIICNMLNKDLISNKLCFNVHVSNYVGCLAEMRKYYKKALVSKKHRKEIARIAKLSHVDDNIRKKSFSSFIEHYIYTTRLNYLLKLLDKDPNRDIESIMNY